MKHVGNYFVNKADAHVGKGDRVSMHWDLTKFRENWSKIFGKKKDVCEICKKPFKEGRIWYEGDTKRMVCYKCLGTRPSVRPI